MNCMMKPYLLLAFLLNTFWVLDSTAQQQSNTGKSLATRIVEAANFRTTQTVRYDPKYVVLEYPGGDVPANTGVCTDVVIRSLRAVGIDLQKKVHEDMKQNFSVYPKKWGLKRPDKNIDHRRVPNLQTYFKRQGFEIQPNTDGKRDFQPGDIIAWDLNDRGLTHVGIVVDRDKFVHNIGAGPVTSKGIDSWTILGHYRLK